MVGEVLAEVGRPADAAARSPHGSRGQRQRVAIARAWVRIALRLLDERGGARLSIGAQILNR